MAGNKITIRLRGKPETNELVRADVLAQKLHAVAKAISETERLIFGDEVEHATCLVSSVSLNSPITVGYNLSGGTDPNAAVRGLFAFMHDAQNDTLPPEFDSDAAEAFWRIASYFGKDLTEIEIRNGESAITIDNQYAANLKNAIERLKKPDVTVFGSVKGMLQRANLHNATTCTIYPKIGPPSISCSFGSDLVSEVERAFNKKVTARGLLRYKAGRPFPYALHIDAIDILPEDCDLPTFEELRAKAIALIGDKEINGESEWGNWDED